MIKRELFKVMAKNPIGKIEIFVINKAQKYKIEYLIKKDPLHIYYQGSFYLTKSIEIKSTKPIPINYKKIPVHKRERIRKKVVNYKESLNRLPTLIIIERWEKELS